MQHCDGSAGLRPAGWSEDLAGADPVAREFSDIGAQQTLREFFRLCDEAGPNCAFSGNSSQRYAALVTRLRDHPVDFRDPITNAPLRVDAQVLISTTLGALYDPAIWAFGAQWLAALEQAASPEQLGRLRAAISEAIGAGAVAQEEYRNVVEGSDGVACSDSLNPHWFSAWPRTADAAERRHGYFGRVWTWTWSACAVWPRGAGQDRYLGPWTARTADPVLIVGNYFDPATRYQGSVTASRLLPNSRLLSYAGWGHVVSYTQGNDCIDSAVTAYLVSTVPPAAGTVCQPEGSPFDTMTVARPADARAASRAGDRVHAAGRGSTGFQLIRRGPEVRARCPERGEIAVGVQDLLDSGGAQCRKSTPPQRNSRERPGRGDPVGERHGSSSM